MARFDEDDLRAIFERGEAFPEESRLLMNFCEMVYKSHFVTRDEYKDDLIHEGLLGIYSLLEEGNYDPTFSITNFVYARVRNVMTNFLYKEDRGYYEGGSYTYKESVMDNDVELDPDAIQKIIEHVNTKIASLSLEKRFEYYIYAYFYDKLGIKYDVKDTTTYSIDFVDKYRYYVNLIEFEIFDKFLGGRVFNNKVSDILDVLACNNDVNAFTTLFFETFSDKQISMLMYIFSGSNLKIPSKYRLLKVDNYISIYKRVLSGTPREDVAKMFGKSVISINSIYDQYSAMFDDLDE